MLSARPVPLPPATSPAEATRRTVPASTVDHRMLHGYTGALDMAPIADISRRGSVVLSLVVPAAARAR